VNLPPKTALTLGLAFHELATNAAKYGALSTGGGQVRIEWDEEVREGRPWLRLRWTESGGPAVTLPERRGFGSRLIERSVAGEARGSARLHFLAEGLAAEVEVPLQADA
jgi:two-component sensor histidine kinase